MISLKILFQSSPHPFHDTHKTSYALPSLLCVIRQAKVKTLMHRRGFTKTRQDELLTLVPLCSFSRHIIPHTIHEHIHWTIHFYLSHLCIPLNEGVAQMYSYDVYDSLALLFQR